MGALGCRADAKYVSWLPGKIAESIERATKLLEPARVGWSVVGDLEHTFCRRWIRRPDKMLDDPFGQRTVRANMHPGYQNPDAIAPAGPVDPALTLLAVQSRQGRPIAVLANYSMHYYGAEPISADYFGHFAAALARRIGAAGVDPPFVAIMSQGTSGDQMWMDYSQPKRDPGLETYGDAVARYAQQAYEAIQYRDWVPLAIAETRLVLGRRLPDAARLEWAKDVVGRMAGRDLPASLPEVYAKEALMLHNEPRRELKLQALRIGDLGVAAFPNEVFAITGLKIKAQSPFETTMNIELANGSEGYIPPPEQHALGGYTTWPARTAGLEVEAEPRIVAALLTLLEQIAGKPRRAPILTHGPYARSVLASRPLAYWRLDDLQGLAPIDSSGHHRDARYVGAVAYYLPGPDAIGLSATKTLNHAVYLAGGRLEAQLDDVADISTVELWFWNGLVNDARPICGHIISLYSRGQEPASSVYFGIQGTKGTPGCLFVAQTMRANESGLPSKSRITPKTWHHLTLIREGQVVTAYIDGKLEITADMKSRQPSGLSSLSIGATPDDTATFEGKIDEVAIYSRALTADEILAHFHAASP